MLVWNKGQLSHFILELWKWMWTLSNFIFLCTGIILKSSFCPLYIGQKILVKFVLNMNIKYLSSFNLKYCNIKCLVSFIEILLQRTYKMLPALCLWMSEGKIYKNGKKKETGIIQRFHLVLEDKIVKYCYPHAVWSYSTPR